MDYTRHNFPAKVYLIWISVYSSFSKLFLFIILRLIKREKKREREPDRKFLHSIPYFFCAVFFPFHHIRFHIDSLSLLPFFFLSIYLYLFHLLSLPPSLSFFLSPFHPLAPYDSITFFPLPLPHLHSLSLLTHSSITHLSPTYRHTHTH